MNRYLTELSTKKRRWHVPVAVLSVSLAAATVETWIEDSPLDENPVTWLLAYLTILCLMLLPLYRIVKWKLRQRSAGIIAARLDRAEERLISADCIDSVLGMKNAGRKVNDLIRHGFLQRVRLENGDLLLDGAEEQPKPRFASDDIIERIRWLNEEIEDESISERIEQIERSTDGILQTIQQYPEQAAEAKRFMEYYLPATLKLLESYRVMEKQQYQGENIRVSRQRIEEVMDEIVIAAQRQLDRLFKSKALDVEAEIRVLETMMTSDGLIGNRGVTLEK